MIKAPYNFVPLSEHIFFPGWSEKISQDVPFKDEHSGFLNVTIKAETPIFVRNGHQADVTDNDFSYVRVGSGRKYFIPGTTVKGCIRNVLEIMSFGKMQPVTDSHTEKNYKNSPKMLEIIRQNESANAQNVKKGSLDLAECIFGTVNDVNILRGRVQFSHFECIKDVAMPESNKEFSVVLNSPNPSVLPLYVCQEGDFYVDYDSDYYPDAILKGWKRYILRTGFWTKKPGKDNVITTFRPLNKGSVFKGRINYHNLKKEELGALICALTWNGEEGCYHHIGQAKPFGFGRVSISIDNGLNESEKNCPQDFINTIMNWLEGLGEKPRWRKHWMINELFVLAKTVRRWDDKKFNYMEGKEGKNAKKNFEYLHSLSEIIKEE